MGDSSWQRIWHTIWCYRVQVVVLGTFLIFLPLPLAIEGQEAQAAYMILVMAVLWMTEIIPLAVTAFIPVFLVPVFGIMTTDEVAVSYMNEAVLLICGAIFTGLCLEKSGLHRRIALKSLLIMGAKPLWLMFGCMMPTWFLALFINNTPCTAMMLPIVDQILRELEQSKVFASDKDLQNVENGDAPLEALRDGDKDDSDEESHKEEKPGISVAVISGNQSEDKLEYEEPLPVSDPKNRISSRDDPKFFTRFCKAFTLCVPYASTCGGSGTLTGSNSNMITKEQADMVWERNGYEESPLTYTSWLQFALPIAFLNLIFCWLWLQLLWLGPTSIKETFTKKDKEYEGTVMRVIRRQYAQLGPFKTEEYLAAFIFFFLVCLWFFRDPEFIDGWLEWFPGTENASPAMFAAFLIFIIPALYPKPWARDGKTSAPRALMDWETCRTKFPWQLIFLYGGGYAMADACEESGLSAWLGEKLEGLDVLPDLVMLFLYCLFIAMLTEVTSNSATTNLIMPIATAMAFSIGKNPLYLMLATGISAQYAFMLPVATPSNAVAFSYGRVSVMDMVKSGSLLNFTAILVACLAISTWGDAKFDLHNNPFPPNATQVPDTAVFDLM